jgi:hypothetical protein
MASSRVLELLIEIKQASTNQLATLLQQFNQFNAAAIATATQQSQAVASSLAAEQQLLQAKAQAATKQLEFNAAIEKANQLQQQSTELAKAAEQAQERANQLKAQALELAKQADAASAQFNSAEANSVRQISDAQNALNKALIAQVNAFEQSIQAQQKSVAQSQAAASAGERTIAAVEKEVALKAQLVESERNLSSAQQQAIAASNALETSRRAAAEATANAARSVTGGASAINQALAQLTAAEGEYNAAARNAFTANEQLNAARGQSATIAKQLAVATSEVAAAQKAETSAVEVSANASVAARQASANAIRLQSEASQKLAALNAAEAQAAALGNTELGKTAALRAQAAQAAQAAVNAQQAANQAQAQFNTVSQQAQQAQSGLASSAQAATSALGEQGSIYERLKQLIGDTRERIGGIAFEFNNVVFAAQTFASGISSTINQVIGQVAQLESQIIGIQATLASTNRVLQGGVEVTNPLEKITSLRQSVLGAIGDIRQKSLELAGVTSDQLIDIFKIVSTNIGQIGGTLNDATKLVGSFSAALGTLGIPLFQARQEINSILLGTIDQNSVLAKQLGINNQLIAQEKQKGTLIEFLTQKLGTLEAGQALIAKTFSGATSNIAEIAQRVQEAFGQALLEPLVTQLNALYNQLSQGQKGFEALASSAGQAVVTIASQIGGILSNLAPLVPIVKDLGIAISTTLATGLQSVLAVVQVLAAPIGALLSGVAALTQDGFGKFLLQVSGVAIALNTLLIPAITASAGVLATGLVQGLVLTANVLKTLSFASAAETVIGFGRALSASAVAIGVANTELVALRGASTVPALTGLVGTVASLGSAVLGIIPGVSAATAAITGLQLAAGGIVLVLGALATGFAAYSAIQAVTKANTEANAAAQEKFVASSSALTSQLEVFNKLRKEGATLSAEQLTAEKALQGEANKQVSVNTVRIEQLEKQKTQWFQNTAEIDKQIAVLKSLNGELNNVTIAAVTLPRIGTAYEQITQKINAASVALKAGVGQSEQFERYAKDVISNTKLLLDQGAITAEEARRQLSVVAENDKLQLGTQQEAQKAITESFKSELNRRLEDQKAASADIANQVQLGKISAIEGEKAQTEAIIKEIQIRREARLKEEEEKRGEAERQQKATLDELVKQEEEAQKKIADIKARGSATQRDQDIKAVEFRIEALTGAAKVSKQLQDEEEKALGDRIFEANVQQDAALADRLQADLTYLQSSNESKRKASDQELVDQRQALAKLQSSKAISNADEIASATKDLEIIADKRKATEEATGKTIAEINRNSRNKEREEDAQALAARLKEREAIINKQTAILSEANASANRTIQLAEKDAQAELIKIRLAGFESEGQLSQKRLDNEKSRLGQQISAQQAYLDNLRALYKANPALNDEEAKKRNATLAEGELKLRDLILKSGELQIQQQQLITAERVKGFELYKQGLENINKLLASNNEVVKAGLGLEKAQADAALTAGQGRLKQLEDIASLRKATLTEPEKAAQTIDPELIRLEKRKLLVQQLAEIGLRANASEREIGAAIRAQEEQIAKVKADRFAAEQRAATAQREFDTIRQQSAQQVLEIEAQIALTKATGSGNKEAIAQAQQLVNLAAEQAKNLTQSIELQKQTAEVVQKSQTEAFNAQQKADDFASKQKAADAGVFGIKTAFAKVNEEAIKLPGHIDTAATAANKLNQGLDAGSSAAQRLKNSTVEAGSALDAASQKAAALAANVAAATQARAASDQVLKDAVSDPALREKILNGADPADLIPARESGGTVLPRQYLVNEEGQEAYTNYSTGETSLIPAGQRVVTFPSDGFVHNADDTKAMLAGSRATGGEVKQGLDSITRADLDKAIAQAGSGKKSPDSLLSVGRMLFGAGLPASIYVPDPNGMADGIVNNILDKAAKANAQLLNSSSAGDRFQGQINVEKSLSDYSGVVGSVEFQKQYLADKFKAQSTLKPGEGSLPVVTDSSGATLPQIIPARGGDSVTGKPVVPPPPAVIKRETGGPVSGRVKAYNEDIDKALAEFAKRGSSGTGFDPKDFSGFQGASISAVSLRDKVFPEIAKLVESGDIKAARDLLNQKSPTPQQNTGYGIYAGVVTAVAARIGSFINEAAKSKPTARATGGPVSGSRIVTPPSSGSGSRITNAPSASTATVARSGGSVQLQSSNAPNNREVVAAIGELKPLLSKALSKPNSINIVDRPNPTADLTRALVAMGRS